MKNRNLAVLCMTLAWWFLPLSSAAQDQPQPPQPQQQKKEPLKLEGRIETLAASATLPAIVFYKQTPKLDKPKLLKGGIEESGYPDYLLGRWGGKLRIVWSARTENTEPPPQCRVGNEGSIVFHFEKVGTTVQLLPTLIYFPAETRRITDRYIQGTPIRSSDFESLQREMSGTGMVRAIPTLAFGGGNDHYMTGERATTRVVYNSLKSLRRGVLEQDIVIGNWRGNSFSVYNEIVTRFTWYSKNKVFVQAAVAQYGRDKKAFSRTVLAGWVDSDWQPTAFEISLIRGKSWEEVMREDGLQ